MIHARMISAFWKPSASAMRTMGTELRMLPKMGMRLSTVAMVASRKANFTPKMQQANAGERCR